MIDVVIILLIVVLSFKGYFNGLMRELVGFVGLIGGVFVASRAAEPLGAILGDLFHLDNPSISKLLAFVLTLLIVWGGSAFVGSIFSFLRSYPYTGLSRWSGMAVAVLKYSLVFSLIAASLLSSSILQNNFASTLDNSRLIPTMKRVGRYLIHVPARGTLQVAKETDG